GFRQSLVVFDEQQIDHQSNDFARREVLSGGLVRNFGKLADQFLEYRAHLRITDHLGMQVDVGEFLRYQIEQSGFGQPVDLVLKIEGLEDVPDGGRKRLDVSKQVFLDVVLIAHEFLHIQRRCVVEMLTGLPQQK